MSLAGCKCRIKFSFHSKCDDKVKQQPCRRNKPLRNNESGGWTIGWKVTNFLRLTYTIASRGGDCDSSRVEVMVINAFRLGDCSELTMEL